MCVSHGELPRLCLPSCPAPCHCWLISLPQNWRHSVSRSSFQFQFLFGFASASTSSSSSFDSSAAQSYSLSGQEGCGCKEKREREGALLGSAGFGYFCLVASGQLWPGRGICLTSFLTFSLRFSSFFINYILGRLDSCLPCCSPSPTLSLSPSASC